MTLDVVEALFDNTPRMPFWVKDRSLRFVAANAAMLEFSGARSRAELIGATAREFFPLRACDRCEALDRQVIRTGKPLQDRLDFGMDACGRPFWVMFARWPLFGPDRAVWGVAATSRNLDAPDRRHPKYERVAAAIEHMRSRFGAELKVSTLARRVGVSPSQLERDFVELFGLSPRRYLTKIRIDAALELLRGETPISQVALECGYADQSAFARRFRSAVGFSPREYRGLSRLTRSHPAEDIAG